MKGAAHLPRATWLVLVFALLTGMLLVPALLYVRAEAIRAAQERTEALSQVIAEQAARTLQAVDSRLELAIGSLELLRAAGLLDAQRARPLLRAQLQDLPFVRAIWVLDPQGRIVQDSDEGNIGKTVGDRDYFQVYRRDPAIGTYVGPLIRSRTTGTWLFSVSRPIRNDDGMLSGVITAAVEPPYFEELWRSMDLGSSGAVVLYHRNGQQIVRSPADASVVGRDFSTQPLFTQFLQNGDAGVYTRRSPVDGVERIVAYRVLPAYPQLLVAVGSGVTEVLAPWRRLAMLSGGIWAAALLIASGLAMQLQKQVSSRAQSERRFRQLAHAMPQIVFMSDARGVVEFVNRRWTEMTGLPAESALGSGWQELLHPADRERTVQTLRERIATGQEIEVEVRVRYGDGAYRWQLLRAVPFRESGRDGWYGTATDVDDLKQAQARLHDQAEVLRMAGRLARMGGWRFDLATQRMRWSEEAAAILDMPAEDEPTLQEVIALFAPNSLAGSLRALQDCIDHGRPFDIEVEMVTPTGRQVWLRSIGQPVLDASGKVVGIQGAQQDITPRMRMLEEIRQLNTGLEEKISQRTSQLVANEAALRLANEQLESFAYSVSHDLQSPLQRIQSFGRLLEEALAAPDGARARHYLSRIRSNADTMAQLIEGLLALARVSEVQMIRSAVNLSDMAVEILQRLQGDQPQRRVAWDVQPGLSVQGDVRLMRSVMENLLGNAWKFTSEKPVARIEVGRTAAGEIFVRDNGAGFDMAYADRLFGTFQRLHDADQFPGTGIGLATVARAISRQGGSVRAEGAVGVGATFFFALPQG